MNEVEGKTLTSSRELVESRPEARRYCDSCKFSNLTLANGATQLICRKRPPQVFAAAMQTAQGIGWASTVLWAGITKEDWCGEHEPDPRGVRTAAPANESVLASA